MNSEDRQGQESNKNAGNGDTHPAGDGVESTPGTNPEIHESENAGASPTEANAESAQQDGESDAGEPNPSPEPKEEKPRTKRTVQEMLKQADAARERRKEALKKANDLHRSAVKRVKAKLGAALLSALLDASDVEQAKILELLHGHLGTWTSELQAELIDLLKLLKK